MALRTYGNSFKAAMIIQLMDESLMQFTDFFILLDHLALLVKSPQPADLLLRLLGQEDVDLLAVSVVQLEGIFHADNEVVVPSINGISHRIAIHVNAPFVVKNVPAYQVLRRDAEAH